MSAEHDAVALVERFLSAISAGRHDEAAACLAAEVKMIFPGARRYSSLSELATSSNGRYRHVDKHRDEYRSFTDGTGDVMVLSIGRLFGENNHGVPFDNVRYVDLFRVRDGHIIEQRVWNDLAETSVLRAATPAELDPRWRRSPQEAG